MHLDDRRQAEKLVKVYRCATCGGALHDPWDGKANAYNAKCGNCGEQERFAKPKTATQAYFDGDPMPIEMENVLERKYGPRRKELTMVQPTHALEKVDPDRTKALTRAMREKRFLSDLKGTEQEYALTFLAQYALAYGFDPFAQEVTLYEGQPYIKKNGYIRKAHEAGGSIISRPMSKDEIELYGWTHLAESTPGFRAYICKFYYDRFPDREPTVGAGRADSEHPWRNNPIEKHHPEWLAESRAIRRCLALVANVGLPRDLTDELGETPSVDPPEGPVIEGECRPADFTEEGLLAMVRESPALRQMVERMVEERLARAGNGNGRHVGASPVDIPGVETILPEPTAEEAALIQKIQTAAQILGWTSADLQKKIAEHYQVEALELMNIVQLERCWVAVSAAVDRKSAKDGKAKDDNLSAGGKPLPERF